MHLYNSGINEEEQKCMELKKTKCIYTIVVLMKKILCHTNIHNRKTCSKHENAICSLQMQITTIKNNRKTCSKHEKTTMTSYQHDITY